jgi:predicted nuclease with RNAse H fold
LKTLGIDLSADPSRTGACEIDWSSGTVSFVGPPASDDALVAAAVPSDMTAIDVPLGWPDGFISAVVAHHRGEGWPPVSVVPPLDRLPLRYRLTDRVVMAGGGRPLSVSSDLIGVAAMRGARLQDLLLAAGVPVDRSGVTGRVVEAYPAAALRAWGLASSRYKGRVNAAACRSLARELAARCGRLGAAAAAALEGCDDNGLDAFVCALVARAVLAGLTTRPAEDEVEVARREGWIYVPTAGVAEIGGSKKPLR